MQTNELIKTLNCDLNHLNYLLRKHPEAFTCKVSGGGRGKQSDYELTDKLQELIAKEKNVVQSDSMAQDLVEKPQAV
jgi:MarR-like DNA-binding transcriptional regulator SgrR of sgrS sRNA